MMSGFVVLPGNSSTGPPLVIDPRSIRVFVPQGSCESFGNAADDAKLVHADPIAERGSLKDHAADWM